MIETTNKSTDVIADSSLNVYEYVDNKGSIKITVPFKATGELKQEDYTVYNNDLLIYKNKWRESYLSLWIPLLRQALFQYRETRVLIVGGGDQLLSNYVLKYPCSITLIDPLAYHYFQQDIKRLLKVKEWWSKKDSNDNLQRKLVVLDMTLEEALEDEVINPEEFDLIIVDNFQDTLLTSTGMYTTQIPQLYYKLLKQNGYLCINNRYGIPKHIGKKYGNGPQDLYEIAKGLRDYYSEYKTSLNSLLNLKDHTTKTTTTIELYKKDYKNMLEEG